MNEYPLTLPGPSQITLKPAERRRVSSIQTGLQQVFGRQRDFLGDESVVFHYTAAQALVFDTWWKGQLVYGGGWFAAAWPTAHQMSVGNRRFTASPRWKLVGHEYWEVSCEFEIRSTLNNSPSGGGVGMEPGGTRLYDLYVSFPSQNGSTRKMFGGLSELTYTWYLSVTTHNTTIEIASGPVVSFVFTVTNADTVNFSAPSFATVTSTTTRNATIYDFGSSSGVIRAMSALPGNFYCAQTIDVRALVGGVDIGEGFHLSCVPDVLTPSGTGVVTGYPSELMTYADYIWSTS